MSRRTANEIQNFNDSTFKMATVFGFALVIIMGLLLAANVPSVSARYLPTRADQSDVDVLKAMIHEILLRPDIDRADLERALYNNRQQQRFGARNSLKQQHSDMIAVQRRATAPESTDALGSPIYGGTFGSSYLRSASLDLAKGGAASAEDR